MSRPALLSWSGGKDSAWTLHRLRSDPQWADLELVGLLTTVNRHFGRIAIHGVREALLYVQAEAANLPVWLVDLPWPCSNVAYQAAMEPVLRRAVREGVQAIAFGDLFLEDIRRFRETALQPFGLDPLFPLWGEPTPQLAQEMVTGGLQAWLTCLDPQQLDPRFAGRRFDQSLLADLPPGVDPCGERGEFHTFVSAGPMFRRSIDVYPGETVVRDGFVYTDLLPMEPHPSQGSTERQ